MNQAVKFVSTVIVIFCVMQNVMCATNYEVALERLEPVEGTLIDFSKLRIIRNKNREYCINGSVIIFEDIDQTTNVSVDTYCSPRGNGQFSKSAFGVPSKPACDVLKTIYRTYVQPSLLGVSNLPEVGPEGLCPLPKGVYYVKCALVKEDEKMITHVPRGLWNIDIQLAQEDVKVAELKVFVKIIDKIQV